MIDRDPGDETEGGWHVGHVGVWHGPIGPASPLTFRCACEHRGTVKAACRLSGGLMFPYRVEMDGGGVIDPSIDPDMWTAIGAPCPWERE